VGKYYSILEYCDVCRYYKKQTFQLERNFTFVFFCVCLFLVVPEVASSYVKSKTDLLDIFNQEDLSFLSELTQIRICVDPDWMPLEKINKDKQHIGVISDIIKLLEQKIGIAIELVPTESWAESIKKLENRECDVVTSDTISDSGSSSLYIKTIPFLKHQNVYITRKDTPLQIDFSQIIDKPIGVTRGYPTIALIKKYYGDVNIIEVKDINEGLLMVSRGELFAFTDLLPICSYSIQSQGLTNLKIAGHLDISFPVVMDIRSDMPKLVTIFNKVFNSIDDTLINQFLARWIKVEYDVKPAWQQVIKYALLALVFVGFILYWNHKLYCLNLKLDKANEQLRLLNELDALTQVKNRNYITFRLPEIVNIANRNQLSFAIAMLDIDYFKHLNDSYGHAIGDKCLVALAHKMSDVFQRESDLIIRYGGEEFLLISIGMTRDKFISNLHFLKSEVESISIPLRETTEQAGFSVSLGYVFYPISPSHWNEQLVVQADKNLYLAKDAGRNKIFGLGGPVLL
jgi:polar amino acid transport system substrate-binding protein